MHIPWTIRAGVALLICCAPALSARGQTWEGCDEGGLGSLALEELMDVEVTSVMKSPMRLFDTPAAATVIWQEDIRRSGMASIPDLLRLSPGLCVPQLNNRVWPISARGFNDSWADKLLVMMDGRTLYQPLFSGVAWETVDYVLQDLDRIEVVRGPGATLWGANAVNGVINIETKDARETQGALLSSEISNEYLMASARYGGRLDDRTWYRVWTRYADVGNSLTLDGHDAGDGITPFFSGFRIDRHATESDHLMLEGNFFDHREGSPLLVPDYTPALRRTMVTSSDAVGASVVGKWTHTVSSLSEYSLKFFLDYVDRDEYQLGYEQGTADIEFEHQLGLGQSHQITWGMGYRYMVDEIRSSPLMQFDPPRRDTDLANIFIQDRMTLLKDRLYLFAGSKFELSGYSGFEYQPSARLLWTPNSRNTLWTSVSRAVRTPSRWEEDGRVLIDVIKVNELPLPLQGITLGNVAFESEDLLAYEAGYRTRLTHTITLDAAAFYNIYHDLRRFNQQSLTYVPTPLPHYEVDMRNENGIKAHGYGGEVAAKWQVTGDWKLSGAYSFVRVDSWSDQDPYQPAYYSGNSPRQQIQAQSYYNLTSRLQLNAAAFYVDRVRYYDIPAYVRVDVNLNWEITHHLNWTIGARNLLDDAHQEFGRTFNDEPTQVQRAFFTRLTWTF